MKNVYKLCLLLVILINPLNLYANDGWFVSAKGGFVINGPFDYKTTVKYTPTNGTEQNRQFQTNLSNIPSFGIAAGYEIDNLIFKAELERNNFHTNKENTDFTYNSTAILLGGYYKFNTSSRLVPYIGAGLGFYFTTDIKLKADPYTSVTSSNKSNFIFHVNLGISYDISDNIAIGIEDKLIIDQSRSFMIKKNDVDYNFSIGNQLINTILLTLKYSFW